MPTVTCDGATSNGFGYTTVVPAALSTFSVFAPLVQLNHKQTDLDGAGGSGLSTGAKAGIGVGVSVFVLVWIGLLIALILRRRKRRRLQTEQPALPAGTHEAASEPVNELHNQHTSPKILPGHNITTPAPPELHGYRENAVEPSASELYGQPLHYELSSNASAHLPGWRNPAELDTRRDGPEISGVRNT
jgi:hypothetical protein